MGKQRLLSLLALCASFFAVGVIGLGALTRLMDAGLGCPDWPGCYGHLAVPLSAQDAGTQMVLYKAWAEMIHRYFVGGLSLFIAGIVIVIFSQKELRVRTNNFLASILILLLVYQILLGRWTVTLKLLPIVVTQHLLGGFFILSTLWLIHVNNNASLMHRLKLASNKNTKLRGIVWGAFGALVLLLVQITLGAWTSTNYASLSCPDFPFCINDQALVMHIREAFNIFSALGVNYEGGVLSEAIRQTIQMMHRFGALILTGYLFLFAVFAMPKLKNIPELLSSLYVILGLLCVQLCLGISNIIFKLPLITAVSHNLIAAILLLSVVTFLFKLIVMNGKASYANMG